MDAWSKIIESFRLTVGEVWKQYTRIPADAMDIFWHYTTHTGLKGILKSGGLRATYRLRMNDSGEFGYARSIIYKALNEISAIHDLSKVEHSLITYTRKNLDKFPNDTTDKSTAYCACLTISSDHPEQWRAYADNGKGFAIGFNMRQFLNMQVPKVQTGQPFILCAPVTYNESDQRDLLWRLLEAGIHDLLTFADTCSQQPLHLTATRDRITQEIVVHLLTLINFIKAPVYSSEREMRLFLDPNDGTSLNERAFLEDLLDELGYGSNYRDRPLITQSLTSMSGSL